MKEPNDLRRTNLVLEQFNIGKWSLLEKAEAFFKCKKAMKNCKTQEQYSAASNMIALYVNMYGYSNRLAAIKSVKCKELLIAEFLD